VRRGQIKSSGEYGQPAKGVLLMFRKEVIAPVKRTAQGLLARQPRATPSHEDVYAAIKLGGNLFEAEAANECRGKLEGEWQPI
jgi:hypothetical protein